MSGQPHIVSTSELPASEARWVTLKKINWKDQEGKDRTWESAERKTRGSAGIDAVAIFALIRSKTDSFAPSTVIVEQFRPPAGKFIVELPAGLIDASETAEQAAIRELKEETGYIADSLLESSPVMVSDPGMTNANMKLVSLNVILDDHLETPKQHLDDGEFITVRVVEVDKLLEELNGYENKGYQVDAKLHHLAWGYDLAKKMRDI